MIVKITGPIELEGDIISRREAEMDIEDRKMMFTLTFIPRSKQNERTLKEVENSVDPIKIAISSSPPSSIPFDPTEDGKLFVSITIGNNEE